MKPKASILILNNSKSKRVVENVKLLLEQETNFPLEIIVADNSAKSENREKISELAGSPGVSLNFYEKNRGYPRDYNRTAALAQGDYFLIVNPDILVKNPGTIQALIEYMEENPDIAILGPKQIDDDGQRTMNVRAFPNFWLQIARRTRLRDLPGIRDWVAHDEMQHLDYEQVQEVDWLQSSFIVVRRDFWGSIGGFEEWFYIFMADPDICFQAWLRGHRVVFYPEVVVYADGVRCSAGGVKDFFRKWLLRVHVWDALKYQIKYLGRGNPRKKKSRKK